MNTKNKFVQVRISEAEHRNLKLLAHRAGVSVSKYIRKFIREESKKRGMPI
jgi:predicted HicB family RNase H-like nuclease